MSNFAFIDVNTQKCFIEHFGCFAIEEAVNIRENLMHLGFLARDQKIPVLSPVFFDEEKCTQDSNDYAKTLDSEHSDQIIYSKNCPLGHQQYLFPYSDLEDADLASIQDMLQRLKVETIMIFGVPLESSIKNLALQLKDKYKVWIIKDCVLNSSEVQETPESILKELKEAGIKSMTTRVLDKFLRDDC